MWVAGKGTTSQGRGIGSDEGGIDALLDTGNGGDNVAITFHGERYVWPRPVRGRRPLSA